MNLNKKNLKPIIFVGILLSIVAYAYFKNEKNKKLATKKVSVINKSKTNAIQAPRLDESALNGDKAKTITPNNSEALQKIIYQLESQVETATNSKDSLLLVKVKKAILETKNKYDHPIFNAYLGDVNVQLGEFEQAVESYKLAYLDIPESEELRLNYGNACFNAAVKNYHDSIPEKCFKYMEKAYQLKKDDESKLYYLGWARQKGVAYIQKNKNAMALPYLKKAKALEPKDYNTVFNYGVALTQLNQYDLAIEQFNECLKIRPGDENSKTYLYANNINKGDIEEASKYIPDNLKTGK